MVATGETRVTGGHLMSRDHSCGKITHTAWGLQSGAQGSQPRVENSHRCGVIGCKQMVATRVPIVGSVIVAIAELQLGMKLRNDA